MENAEDTWQRKTSKRIGAAVARYRGDARMTAQRLSEKCAELGLPIHRTTITKIENGRSGFDVGELLILAAALDVPPLALLFPELPDGPVDMLPGQRVSSMAAFLWASGLEVDTRKASGSRLVKAVLERRSKMRDAAHAEIQRGLYAAANPALSEGMAAERDSALDAIARLDAEIREAGGVIRDA